MPTSVVPKKTITTVDKRSNITHKELIAEYIEPSIPVILKADATKDWPAMGKFTPEFFKKNYAHLSKVIDGVKYTMPEYIDLMLASTPEKPAPYPFNFDFKVFPELKKDVTPEIIYSKSDRVNNPFLPKVMLRGTTVYEMFFGGNGSFFPYLHIDALYLHAQITQLYGAKDFILYPPDQKEFLYPRTDNTKASQLNIFAPDYDRFPLFKNATPIKVTVEQGETILFPTGWWHTTQIHEPCISFGRAQLNAANWNAFTQDNHKSWKKRLSVFSVLPLLYSKALGQAINVYEKF